MEQQLLTLSALIVGLILGHLLTKSNKQYYNDMRDFANSYSNLATQLFNIKQNQDVPTNDPMLMRNRNHQPQPDTDDLDLLGGMLDPITNETIRT